MTSRVRHVIGCMTGTSLDGLDAVLTRIEGDGLAMKAAFVRMASRTFPDDLRHTLRSLASAQPHPAEDFVRAARALGEFHAEVVAELTGNEGVDFVVAHGQTIFHAGDAHLSWQLFDPWPIVRRLNVPVCCDLRQADLIAGGQGAPITPLADWVMYADPEVSRLVVNLGGICNISDVTSRRNQPEVYGGDVGPCNLIIDGVVRVLYPDRAMDEDGRIAESGRAFPDAYDLIRASPFYHRRHGGSTGREDFDDAFIQRLVNDLLGRMGPTDVVASVVDAVSHIVADGIYADEAEEAVLAGGGARHPVLVRAIRKRCEPTYRVLLSDNLGIPCEAREAMGFTVLGALSQDRVPITLPIVTGAEKPGIAGSWVYP